MCVCFKVKKKMDLCVDSRVLQRELTLRRCRTEPSRSVMVGTSWLTGTGCPP